MSDNQSENSGAWGALARRDLEATRKVKDAAMDELQKARERIAELESEKAALLADAERYRWLDENFCRHESWFDEEGVPGVVLHFEDMGETLADAIEFSRTNK